MARRLRHLLIALILSCFYNRKNTLKTYMVMADDTFSSNPEGSGHSNLESTAPLKHPPIDMISAFTMNNTIPIEYYYVDDTNRTAGPNASRQTHYKFSSESLDLFLRGADRAHGKIRDLQGKLGLSHDSDLNLLASYLHKDQWIYLATLKYLKHVSYEDFEGRRLNALVVGSNEPWIEGWLVHLGVRHVVTSEYNMLTYEHEKMTTISEGCRQLADRSEYQGHFDIIISLSSFDHDGLGRYGDEINPNGDLDSMRALKKILSPNGLLFLSVPIGPDLIVWNLHRRYGQLRLPLLLEGWDEVGRIGWNDEKISKPADFRKTYEPIFVLTQTNLQSQRSEL